MSSKPSRSEIENALSGGVKKQRNRQAQPQFDLDAPPRRQQVIGGDLTGVTNRPKIGLFSRYGNVSISYWVAGAIVLLIIIAFFWPKGGESTREIANAEAKLQDQLSSSIEPIEVITPLSNSFTRDSDLDRANNYRSQEQDESKIRDLLQTAQTFLAQGKYTEPQGENAAETYREILTLNPNNLAARQGISAINERFLAAGYSALKQNNQELAKNALNRLATVNKDSQEYQELASAIENWALNQQIAQLIVKAEIAFAKDALILPSRKNALYFYRQALALDETSLPATKGLQKIADTFIKRANDAVLIGQNQTAAAHLATVSVIDPDHTSIALIEAMMEETKPVAVAENTIRPGDTAPKQAESERSNSGTPQTSTNSTNPTSSSPASPGNENKSASRQATEQANVDRQYLKQGLDAYYKGEYKTAAALLRPLADKGVARAQFRLAYMHYLGRGFSVNRREADRRIRAALPAIRKFAEEGRSWAQSDLGSLYEDGLVLRQDFGEAVYWYRSAAEQGYPGAQTNLGFMYARGLGVTASRRTAIRWFQRAAKQGDNVAIRNLEALGVN